MRKFLVSHVWWITLLLALAMLIAHTAALDIKVDNISIILLVIILLSPFAPAITKIKIGEFEAEINSEEVRRIRDKVSAKVKETDEPTEIPKSSTLERIESLVSSDPVLALAKLRIELEKILNRLYQITHRDKQRRFLSAGQLVHKLVNAEIIPMDVAESTREIISICNRAIHGEDIRQQDAESVVQVGVMLLRELSFFTSKYILEPIKSAQIDQSIVDEFQNAKYRVTTIVPLVNVPHKNIRIVDQEGLDEFLEGYGDYAEFVIEVTKVDSD